MTHDNDDDAIFPQPGKRPEDKSSAADGAGSSDNFELDFDLQPTPTPPPTPADADQPPRPETFPAAAAAGFFDEDDVDSEAASDTPEDPDQGGLAGATPRPDRRPGQVLAFGLVAALGVTALTGMGLSFHYAPDTGLAHASLVALEQDEPLGALLRTLHWLGSGTAVALGLVALIWGFVRAEYRVLGTTGWWTGVAVVLGTLAIATTGELLPWTEQAVLATEVRTGILSVAPGLGDRLQSTVLGGDEIANPTLLRFHALHVALLPALLLGLVWLHVRSRRNRVGDDDGGRGLGIPAALFGVLVAAVVGYGSWAMTAPADEPSVPAEIRERLPEGAPLGEVYVAGDEGYVAWPEWYFLWLNKLLKVFPPEYEIVPALVIPGLLVLVLLLLPWLDRSRARRFAHPLALWPGLLAVGGMIGLGIANHLDRPLEPGSEAAEAALAAFAEAPDTPPPPADEGDTGGEPTAAPEPPVIQKRTPPYELAWNDLEREGYALVRRHDCMDCHEWNVGGVTYGEEQDGAPPLHEMLRDTPIDEYVEMIADPEGVLGTEDMPAFDHVPVEQLRAIAHFLRRVGEE